MKDRFRILVIDDESDMREGLWDVLEDEGYRVTTIESSEEAIDIIKRLSFDVILLDIRMPGMNGMKLLTTLKEISPETMIIVMTGYASIETVVEATKKGAYDYITKPFDMEVMERAIKEALRERKECLEKKELKNMLEEVNKKLKTSQNQLAQYKNLATIGRLGAGVTHEVKNLLGIINISTHYLKSKIGNDDPKIMKHLRAIEDKVSRANELIVNLLGFSRPDEAKILPTDINNLMEDILTLMEHQMSLDNIKVIRKLDYKLPQILVDPGEIKKVFVNMIINAQDAMPDGGEMRVTTDYYPKQSPAEVVEIKLEDTGCGIPEENLKDIFEPFFTTKKDKISAGLGLSVCVDIIKKYHGSIEVNSRVGDGTTFIIKLPVEIKSKEVAIEGTTRES